VVTGDEALLELVKLLKERDYRFTAVTPATHARVLERPCERPGLRDIFGWNRSFPEADLEPELLECLIGSGMIDRNGDAARSTVRAASIADDLLLHSAFPTVEADVVFLGPDTYRFVRFISDAIPRLDKPPARIVDMGTGSGAGAIAAAHLVPSAQVSGVDVNPAALRFAAINSEAAEASMELLLSAEMPKEVDLVIANPPYMMDAGSRAYRDGGGLYGGQMALDWAQQALASLTPGGTMLLYSGASVVSGKVPLVSALQALCGSAGAALLVEETDPDVFGEELAQPAYAKVERIAVICATIRKT
jgi:methylase of polypeptide subunit release factors